MAESGLSKFVTCGLLHVLVLTSKDALWTLPSRRRARRKARTRLASRATNVGWLYSLPAMCEKTFLPIFPSEISNRIPPQYFRKAECDKGKKMSSESSSTGLLRGRSPRLPVNRCDSDHVRPR